MSGNARVNRVVPNKRVSKKVISVLKPIGTDFVDVRPRVRVNPDPRFTCAACQRFDRTDLPDRVE
jgi:hypothetical protein